ncbi:toxin Cry1Ac domain D-VI-related protein [Listeria booriae]|uniref:Bacterial Ig domain-containing protein n=1 Tax=Listeria booriae TaxID=1552123 RepID=A0A842ALY8_9LIST|nr:toxin Cry1Ac domain D-VI-related protein [Listeria booriae]MBC1401018.1 hypothetical protein [Listeria booriae]MBC1617155.1 hypothetical protein [Listeria booriae]MBC2320641.1 hypothetical protein [Listeria booriae]
MSKKQIARKVLATSAAVAIATSSLGAPLTAMAEEQNHVQSSTEEKFKQVTVGEIFSHFTWDKNGNLTAIHFPSSTTIEKYNFRLMVDNVYYASIDKGTVYYSYLSGSKWSFTKPISASSTFRIEIINDEGKVMGYITKDGVMGVSDDYWISEAKSGLDVILAGGVAIATDPLAITTIQASIDQIKNVSSNPVKQGLQNRLNEANRQYTYNHNLSKSIDNLFTSSSQTALQSNVTQSTLDELKKNLSGVVNLSWRERLTTTLSTAQTLLDQKAEVAAKTAADSLFVNNDPSKNIKGTTTQADIDAAQAAANKVTDPTVKADLQKEIDKAQAQLDVKTAEKAAKTAVDALFVNNDPSKDIKATTTQADINAAQALVNKVTDATVKAELQKEINKAQSQLVGEIFSHFTWDKNGNLTAIHFPSSTTIEKYNFRLMVDNVYYASIDKGTVYYSYLSGSKWSFTKPISASSTFRIEIIDDEGKVTGYLTKDGVMDVSDNYWISEAKSQIGQLNADGVNITNTQAQINDAQEAVRNIYAYANITVKNKLQAQVTEMQRQYTYNHNLSKSIGNLFTSPSQTALQLNVTQATLDVLKKQLNGVVNLEWRCKLAITLSTAQTLLDQRVEVANNLKAANEAVNKLFGDGGHTKLAEGITATDINQAKALANKVSNAGKKKELLDEIEKAQKLLDEVESDNEWIEKATNCLDEFLNRGVPESVKPGDFTTAQSYIDKVVSPSNNIVKQGLQTRLMEAERQYLYNWELNDDVSNLFVNGNRDKLQPYVTQVVITRLKCKLSGVVNFSWRYSLTTIIQTAQQLFDVREAESAANGLFGDNAHTTLAEGITATDINQAKVLANEVADAAKKKELLDEIEKAQKLLNAKTMEQAAEEATNNLFDKDGKLAEGTTQQDIDKAKEEVNKVADEEKKNKLLAEIEKAQELLHQQQAEAAAKTAADSLFVNNDPSKNIKDTTTQADIDAAQAAANKVTDPTVKADLQKEIDKAQAQLDAKTAEKAAKTAVDALFVNNDPSKDIKATTTQADINAAQALVNKVTDATVKAELQKEINKAQSQLNVSASITATAAKYTTGDMYITGTFTGPVTALSLDVNGKRYYGGDIYASNGTYRFYVSDKKLKAGDVVTMNFYDKTKQIKKSVTITVVEPLKVTVADYKVGANYINATYNNPKITKVGLVVDGVKYWGGDVANGTVKYFAADKIKSATAVVTMNFYDANNNLLASRPVKVQPTAVGEVNTANFKVGTSNIKGTFSGDVKQIAISINGKKYYGGTVSSSDGSYKFYVLDKKITAADTVVVYGYDSSGKLLSQKDVTITE